MSVWVGAVCAILWIWSVARIRMQSMVPAPDGYILGPREVDVSDEGLRERSDRHESLFRWATVRVVECSGDHLFIMVDTSAGFIVPLRSFPSLSEREQFLDEVQRHVSSCSRSAA